MANKTYIQLLKDPRWQRKRLEILERDKWKCVHCENDKESLQVHHKQYRYGTKSWEYEEWDLETLCEPCHAHATKQAQLLKSLVPNLSISDMDVILGFGMALVMRHRDELLDVGDCPFTTYGAAAFVSPRKSVFDAIAAGERNLQKLKDIARAESPGVFDDIEQRIRRTEGGRQ